MTLSFYLTTLISYLMALIAMAFYTLLERKLLAYFQLRKGPNKVLLMGLPQPMADALKLFMKEQSTPSSANLLPFMAAPALGLTLALGLWVLYPLPNPSMFIPLGALLFLCLSSMNVYTILAAGWFSNSKYALLGSLRGVAQTISYEVSMALIFITPLMLHTSFDLSTILHTSLIPKVFPLFPIFLMWMISILAETSRTPFDFAEGESELVSGFNVEYSAGNFALIFMAEYANILLMSLITSGLFLIPPMSPTPLSLLLTSSTLSLSMSFIWIRATFPRLRYDLLMSLAWKTLLPLTLSLLLLYHTLTSLCLL